MSLDKIFANKPLNFAHRGFTKSATENTLSAFKAAFELGVDGIELDVRTCKSGEVIVFHDPTLNRLTDGRGFVKNKTLDELQRFRIRNSESGVEERIPTLEEVIEFVGDKVILNVEIKANGLPKVQIEKKVVGILQKYGIDGRTIISSFNPLVLRRIRKFAPDMFTGFLIEGKFNLRKSEIPFSKMVGAQAIHIKENLATEEFIKKLQKLGYYCIVWGVNEAKSMLQLSRLGIEAIITDNPDVFKQVKMSAVYE